MYVTCRTLARRRPPTVDRGQRGGYSALYVGGLFVKALVLEGRTGLLGQALRHVLLGRGWSVESLERSDGDILDAGFLQARVEGCAPDVVFSSLGWNTVDDAEDHPDEVLLYNRTLPHTLACLLKTRGQGHLVHFSSGLAVRARQAQFRGRHPQCLPPARQHHHRG